MSAGYHPPPSPSHQGRGISKTLSPGGRREGEGGIEQSDFKTKLAPMPVPPSKNSIHCPQDGFHRDRKPSCGQNIVVLLEKGAERRFFRKVLPAFALFDSNLLSGALAMRTGFGDLFS